MKKIIFYFCLALLPLFVTSCDRNTVTENFLVDFWKLYESEENYYVNGHLEDSGIENYQGEDYHIQFYKTGLYLSNMAWEEGIYKLSDDGVYLRLYDNSGELLNKFVVRKLSRKEIEMSYRDVDGNEEEEYILRFRK